MGLLSAILWIFAGGCYIIYKAFTEERDSTLWVLKYFAVVMGPLFAGVGVFNGIISISIEISERLDKKGIAVLGLFIAISASVALVVGAYKYASKKEDERSRTDINSCRTKSSELYRRFIDSGVVVSKEMIDRLCRSQGSPAYIAESSNVSLNDCYSWLCREREKELYKMSDLEIDNELGIKLDSIPINNCIDSWIAVRQRKALAIRYILKRDGLDLSRTSDIEHEGLYWLKIARQKDNSDYEKMFKLYIPNYESDVRSVYERDCRKREKELSSMDIGLLNDLLGIDIETIPLNSDIDRQMAIKQRKALAVKYIMEKEGLGLAESTEDTVCLENLERDAPYYSELFREYIKNNNLKTLGKNRENELNKMKMAKLDEIVGVSIEQFLRDTGFCQKISLVKPYVVKYIVEEIDGLTIDRNGKSYSKINETTYSSFKKCFVSYKRECELVEMRELDFDKLIGVPLKDLPLNNEIELHLAEAQRKAIAIGYIMDLEGLTLSVYGWTSQSIKRTDTGSLYPQVVYQYLEDYGTDGTERRHES